MSKTFTKKSILVFAGLITLAVFSFVLYLYLQTDQQTFNNAASNPRTKTDATTTLPAAAPDNFYPTTLPLKTLADGSMRYQNAYYRFSLNYPSDLSINEYAEDGGGRTITFENASSTKGFQIYILPYNEKQISPERFKLDEPSGIRKQPIDVIIDGIRATAFFGENAVMGETREVWFIIRNHYLRHHGFVAR